MFICEAETEKYINLPCKQQQEAERGKRIADLKLKKINLLLKNYEAFRELDANPEKCNSARKKKTMWRNLAVAAEVQARNGKAI